MRLRVTTLCLAVLALTAHAQTPLPTRSRPAIAATPVTPPLAKDLPVRKVVLYKNGVGYFEHAGGVNGNQRVTIDFTSPQLNDVLQSLTVLDEGGGRIAGVNYNSTTPLAEQLKTLSLGMGDNPNSTELFQALRGQRVEVTGVSGGPIIGRLMSIETRTEKLPSADSDAMIDKNFLTLVSAAGAVRVVDLTPMVSVRPLDSSLQGQLDRYLELLSTTHSTGLRHLTLNALGQGQRELRVSYISEVPVWKSTYRLVFPREPNGNAVVQGWAVVDNTVGADWDNVQLSLVAGAPQSFIQPLSQPIYTRRPEIPIATGAQMTPQTHEAAEMLMDNKQNFAQKALRQQLHGNYLQNNAIGGPQQQAVQVEGQNFADLAAAPPPAAGAVGAGSGYGGGVYRPSDAISEGDVSTNAFDDFFEYALTQPVTIHKNESAMVPILQQELPAEHVTLWSRNDPRPLRTVWIQNKSKLTLDSGSFSIFESGEFAGEGLLNTIHPGERRLLSYAADRAIRVRFQDTGLANTVRHLSIRKGSIVQKWMQLTEADYNVSNADDNDRVVLIEHPRHSGGDKSWSLQGDLKPAETTAGLYRFLVKVPAHGTAKLEVREKGPQYVTADLRTQPFEHDFLLNLIKQTPEAQKELQPVLDAQEVVADLNAKITESKKQEETAAADEARDRENLTALKGNDAAHRFVEELNRAEDELQATRKRTADLEQQKTAAEGKLNQAIASLSFDWDERVSH
jgi:hypothetical protein